MAYYDVTALGELLIDFTEHGLSAQGNPLLEANPGGAPCNALAMLAKLGRKTAFIGKVGTDIFGTQLKQTLEECHIGANGLVRDKKLILLWHLSIKRQTATENFLFAAIRAPI